MGNPLADWEAETELSIAMTALLRADGEAAFARAIRHRETWLGRAIAFAAKSMFMYDPAGAGEQVYGDMPGFEAMARSDTAESHFLRGLSAMFRRQAQDALAAFERAGIHAPGDPFIAFALYALTTGSTWPADIRAAAVQRWSTHASHPLAGAAAIMFRAG
jgi:hypothetical protein